ncbi:hypothetical protein RND81_10G120500 [Saponaria officinalis]|uniref:F-box associated beta-propeller type 3 domain-containing protein n=1 Tax=Saponaria officinalis TaxID=3572 RepID=A0AAW1I1J1_SAPOF
MLENLLNQVFLWNPSINKAINVPLPQLQNSRGKFDIDCAFGFDPITNEYKIVASFYVLYESQFPKFVDIYTLSNDSWRNIDMNDIPYLWVKDAPKCYLNGFIYWVSNDPMKTTLKGRFPYFVSFDVSKEVFKFINLPNCELINEVCHERSPIELNGSVGLIDTYLNYTNIWVMDQSISSWTKLYKISLPLFHKCLYLKEDGNLLHAGEHGGIYLYNLETQEKKVVAKSYKITPFFIRAYEESLVLYKGLDDRNTFCFPVKDQKRITSYEDYFSNYL